MSRTLALGTGTLAYLTSGTDNCIVGNETGLNLTTGSNNIYLGNRAGNDIANESNVLRIGPVGQYVITGNLSTGSVVVSNVTMNAGGLSATSITATATSNQITLGGATNTKITAPTPASSQTCTIPDQSSNLGVASTFMLTTNTVTYTKTGTWTATLGDGTNNFTLSINASYYSVIGDTVIFTSFLQWTSKGSATGNLVISIPFTCVSGGGNYRGAGIIQYLQNVTYSGVPGLTLGGTSGAFVNIPSNGTPTNITATNCGATGQIIVSGFFRTT